MNILTLVIINITVFGNAFCALGVHLMINEPILSTKDTIIVKGQLFNNDFIPNDSEQYYYWISKKNDTLDFKILVSSSYEKFFLEVRHDSPILFSEVLSKIKQCLPIIKDDYDLSRLKIIGFRKPLYYLDLAQELSTEYYKKFGNRRIGYRYLDQFLLGATITSKLNSLLKDANASSVRSYSFEKFRFLAKTDYKDYLPNVDFGNYPDFVLDGYTGFSVFLQ